MKLNFYLRYCKWLWITILVIPLIWWGVYSTFPAITESDAIVLAAPRDLVAGMKDPYYISSIAEVWEPLIGVDDDGHIQPVLATEWSANENQTVWRFKLRKDVVFHDGTPFNADAVIANVHRWQLMNKKSSPFYTFTFKETYPSFIDIQKVGDDEVQFIFESPQPLLIERMIGFSSPIFSPSSFSLETGDFVKVPSGTGPFKILSYATKRSVTLGRFDEYYGEKAKESTIIIKNIPSVETRYAALQSEEILGVLDLGGMSPSLTLDLLKDSRFKVSTNQSRINQMLLVNQSHWPYNQPGVVEAISELIDREFIIKNYFTGQAVPQTNLLNTLAFGAIKTPITYDKEKALEVLRAVIGDTPVKSTLIIAQYGVNRYSYKEVAQYLQAQLREANIDLSIYILDGAAHKKMLSQGAYDFSMGTHGLSSYDPTYFLQGYMNLNGSFNKSYHLGYVDPIAVTSLKELSSATTREEKKTFIEDLQRHSYEHMPAIPLAADLTSVVYNDERLQHYEATTYGINLRRVERR